MAHGIMELDRLVVGFVELYGKAWHEHPNCKHVDGPVSFEDAEKTFEYVVEKRPVVISGTEIVVPGSHVLIRNDEIDGKTVTTIVYPSVGDRYIPIQNSELLAWIEAGILVPYNVSIESSGTLLNGQKAFVNIILNEHTVAGDCSPTITRMMVSNSFGMESYMACIHDTRIVCNNTARIAQAQGASNKTLKKFRHTKNAAQKIEDHMVDLAEIVATTREHHQQLDVLSQMKMTGEQVNEFMDILIPLPKDDDGKDQEGRGLTRRQNQRDAILNLFENKDDLQGKIAKTRYSMFQSITDWADHESPVRNGDDVMGRFWDGIWGNKDKFKQAAWEAILKVR